MATNLLHRCAKADYLVTVSIFVLLCLHKSLLVDAAGVCSVKEIRVSDASALQKQREGQYKLLHTDKCTGRPVWISKSGQTNYIFYHEASNGWSGWLIGDVLCSTTADIFVHVEGSTRCPCDPVLTGQWAEADGGNWRHNTKLTVKCMTNGGGTSDGQVLAWPVIGALAGGTFIAIVLSLVIYCITTVRNRTRTTNTATDVEHNNNNSNTSRISTVSGQITMTQTSVIHSSSTVYSLPPSYSNGVLPPSYSMVSILTTATAPPYEESMNYDTVSIPPSYDEIVMGSCGHDLTYNRQTTTVETGSVSATDTDRICTTKGQGMSNRVD